MQRYRCAAWSIRFRGSVDAGVVGAVPREFLDRWDRGSLAAVETTGNGHWIVDEICDGGRMNWPDKPRAISSSTLPRAQEGKARRQPRPFFVELGNAERGPVLFDLLFQWGSLPSETRVHVAFETLGARPAVTARPEVLKRHGIVVLRPRQTALPAERRDLDGKRTRFDLDRIYALSAARETLIPGIRIPPERALLVAIQVLLPADVTADPLRFDVVQQAGKRVVGGSTCFV